MKRDDMLKIIIQKLKDTEGWDRKDIAKHILSVIEANEMLPPYSGKCPHHKIRTSGYSWEE